MAGNKKVAIIGAGPSGLVAIKSCLEEGFLPVCYERNSDPGGLWRYHEEDIEGVASVMRTTIINTSKEMSAYSDFPPPREAPNFMHNSKLFDYFMSYAKHFNLLRHIRYNLEVVKVEQTEDFEQTGRWIVSVKSTKTNAITKESFDAVMICMGHHVFPNIPTFPNQDKFKGTIIHTHSIKSCDRFKGKKVCVVGIGNSGVDAAIDSTYVAEQVYLSSRRGSWISPRVGKNGRPSDIDFNSRSINLLKHFLSFETTNKLLEQYLEERFDHEAYNLKPKHHILSAHPTINDALPNAILSGRVVIKGDIERFEENGILFLGENTITEIDVIILATGYQVKFPFLDDSILPVKENRVHLYKYSIPPHLKHKTLTVIGLIQPLGCIFPISEMQCRWFMQILSGKLQLPCSEEMEKEIQRKNEENSKRYVDSVRHTIQVDYIEFMDELAEIIGVKPNFWKMAITDPKLFWVCVFGPALSYQYRLVGPHPWPEARKTILSYEDRLFAPLNKKGKKIAFNNDSVLSSKKMLYIIFVAILVLAVVSKYDMNLITNYLK